MSHNIYNPHYVKMLFDKMSDSYERMNYITSFGFSIRWRKQCLQIFPPNNKKIEVIDLLTGMGEMWNIITKQFPNANITALDFSEGMLHYAKNKNDKEFGNNITLLQQDILNNQLPSDSFDIVSCAFGLKTFDENQLQLLAKETYRILKKGGCLTFMEVSKPDNLLLFLLYRFYLGKIIPILGRLLLGNPDTYTLLWQYTNQFENAKKAASIFESTGLNITFKSYFWGCATGFYGYKKG